MTRARDLADLIAVGGSLPAATSIGDVSSTELGYLDGVTSALQTQVDGKLATPGTWTSYTPVLTASTTNPILGSTGYGEGKYTQIGKLVVANGMIVFQGTGVNAGSGSYRISLPVAASFPGPNIQGVMWLYNGSIAEAAIAADLVSPGNVFQVYSSTGGGFSVNESNPWTWNSSDQIRWSITYEAA